MASNKNNVIATACECSHYEAMITEQLTEENLASGSYEIFTTGCNAATRNTFAPGHDAKLKSFLIKHSASEYEIRRNDGVAVTDTALGHAKRYAFSHMVAEGIAKKLAKDEARAKRESDRAARKIAATVKVPRPSRPIGVVAPTPAPSLAAIVAKEEADHAAKVAASRPAPEWDDEPQCSHDAMKDDDVECPGCGAEVTAPAEERRAPVSDGDDEILNVNAREEAERDLVEAKVGRWTYNGFVADDETFCYVAKDGGRKTVAKGKYSLI